MIGVAGSSTSHAVSRAEFCDAVADLEHYSRAAIANGREVPQPVVHFLICGNEAVLTCVIENLLHQVGPGKSLAQQGFLRDFKACPFSAGADGREVSSDQNAQSLKLRL